MELWRITKGGVLDECMIELPPLTDGNVRQLRLMRDRIRKWFAIPGDQIHKITDGHH
jgi:hypothetical protein